MTDATCVKNGHCKWWILSLALAVTLTAILFVVFAGYIGDLRKQIQAQDSKINEIAEQQSVLVSEIDALRKPATDAATAPPTPITPDTTSVVPEVPSLQVTPAPAVTSPATAPAVITPPAMPDVPVKP